MTNIDGNKIEELEEQKTVLLKRKAMVIKDLEDSLDKYMKNLPESPLLLPIKTKIFIEDKNITIEHVSLMLTDPGSKLYDILTNYFIGKGNRSTITKNFIK